MILEWEHIKIWQYIKYFIFVNLFFKTIWFQNILFIDKSVSGEYDNLVATLRKIIFKSYKH